MKDKTNMNDNEPKPESETRPLEALVIPSAWDDFDPKKIHLVFSNIEEDPRGITHYGWITKDKNDRLIKILYLSHSDCDEFQFHHGDLKRFEKDKVFVTNFPFETFEDFAIDLERIGIELKYNMESI